MDLEQTIAELELGLPPAADAGFLGSRLDPAQAALLLLPVPWEATVSYGRGTARGPEAIRLASHQLDLEDPAFGQPYHAGIVDLPPIDGIEALNRQAIPLVQEVVAALETGKPPPAALDRVNAIGAEVNQRVRSAAEALLEQNRLIGLVGGDHSCPFGLIQALAQRHPDGFGVLHIDAHHDLRHAFEGFTWSHASIFRNVMARIPQVSRLTQVAIRDYSREEAEYARALDERNRTFYAADLFRRKAVGETFHAIAQDIIQSLPEKVYISFDIDGLDPPYCPHTGTPVPGGLSFDEAGYLLEQLAASGRRIIGFDLCEVAPADNDEWDANVGARILYKLCGATLRGNGLC